VWVCLSPTSVLAVCLCFGDLVMCKNCSIWYIVHAVWEPLQKSESFSDDASEEVMKSYTFLSMRPHVSTSIESNVHVSAASARYCVTLSGMFLSDMSSQDLVT
jgi:hypothetical protein